MQQSAILISDLFFSFSLADSYKVKAEHLILTFWISSEIFSCVPIHLYGVQRILNSDLSTVKWKNISVRRREDRRSRELNIADVYTKSWFLSWQLTQVCSNNLLLWLYHFCCNNLVTNLVPSSLLQVINSVFQTCSNNLKQAAQTKLVKACEQTCSNKKLTLPVWVSKDRFAFQPYSSETYRISLFRVHSSRTNDMDTIEFGTFRYDTTEVENGLNAFKITRKISVLLLPGTIRKIGHFERKALRVSGRERTDTIRVLVTTCLYRFVATCIVGLKVYGVAVGRICQYYSWPETYFYMLGRLRTVLHEIDSNFVRVYSPR